MGGGSEGEFESCPLTNKLKHLFSTTMSPGPLLSHVIAGNSLFDVDWTYSFAPIVCPPPKSPISNFQIVNYTQTGAHAFFWMVGRRGKLFIIPFLVLRMVPSFPRCS